MSTQLITPTTLFKLQPIEKCNQMIESPNDPLINKLME